MKLFSVVVILFWNFSWTRQQQRQGSFCPSECDCIWKRGKETVSCVNLGLDSIPGLNTGTQVLDLSGNLLGALADSAFVEKDLANLQEISLSKCGIFRIDESAFKRLTNLVVLDLADNRISSLQSLTAAFKEISQLRRLILTGNNLSSLPPNAFSPLSHLTRLELSRCGIASIDVSSFSGLGRLQWLLLDDNDLVHLSPASLRPLSGSLHGVDLHDNPWRCSCRLRPLKRWTVRFRMPSSIPNTCNSPARVRGEKWRDLAADDFACPPIITEAYRITSSRFVCQWEGDPLPVIQWTWQGQIIKNGSASSFGQVFLISESITDDADTMMKNSELRIIAASNNNNISTVDSGRAQRTTAAEITCQGANAAGSDSASMTLAPVAIEGGPLDGSRPRASGAKKEERKRVYVMAAFGGSLVVFATLFAVCCVYNLRQKPSYSLEREEVDLERDREVEEEVDEEEKPLRMPNDLSTGDNEAELGGGGGKKKPQADDSLSSSQRENHQHHHRQIAAGGGGGGAINSYSSEGFYSNEGLGKQVDGLPKNPCEGPTFQRENPHRMLNNESYHYKATKKRPLSLILNDGGPNNNNTLPRVRFDLPHNQTLIRSPSDPLISFNRSLNEDFHNNRKVRFRTRSTSADDNAVNLRHTCNNNNNANVRQRRQRNRFSDSFEESHQKKKNRRVKIDKRRSFHEEQENEKEEDLERVRKFFHEYRELQMQLIRMKEACDNLKRVNLRQDVGQLRTSIVNNERNFNSSYAEEVRLRPILKKNSAIADPTNCQ